MKQEFKKPRQWRAYFTLAWYAFRAQTRNPATFAFGFIFPIVFISIFGLIGNSSPAITLGIPNNSNITNPISMALTKQSFIKIDREDQVSLSSKLHQGKIAGILEIAETPNQKPAYHILLTTSSANPIQEAEITTLIGAMVDKLNLSLSGVTNPPIAITKKRESGRESRYIDFALPGQIGFSLLSTAVFGTVFGLIYLKKALVLKRMFSTPTKPLTILLAQGTSRLIMALLQTMLILGVGVLLFKFFLPHGIITFLELLILCSFGLVAFLGFGYFMAGLANDENSAGPLVNLVTLPQFLLSGTFFPTDSLPTWLQPIANNLPLSYFNIAIRKITTEGGHLTDTLPYLLGLAFWSIIMYLLAAKTFKWE